MEDEKKLLRERFEPKEIKTFSVTPQLTQARWSLCGKVLAGAGFDGRVRRWDATNPDWPELPAIAGHGGWVTALAFAPAGDLLYSADSWGQVKATPYSGESVEAKWTQLQAHDGWVRELSVSPDGSRLASCGIDKRVRVWNTTDGSKVAEFSGHGEQPGSPQLSGDEDGDVMTVRFHPTNGTLLTGDGRGVIRQWDLATTKPIRQFDASSLFKLDRLQDIAGVRCLAFDKTGDFLAVGGVQPKNGGTVVGIPTVLVFEVATGELKQTLTFGQPNDCFVLDVHFHDAGFLMIVTCGTPGSGQLLLQRPTDTEPFFSTKKMVNCQSLTRHPESRRLAVVATNAGSNGNGRPTNKDGQYEPNKSPIFIWEMPVVS